MDAHQKQQRSTMYYTSGFIGTVYLRRRVDTIDIQRMKRYKRPGIPFDEKPPLSLPGVEVQIRISFLRKGRRGRQYGSAACCGG